MFLGFLFTVLMLTVSAQTELEVTGSAKLIADFSSLGEKPNAKGVYLEKYQTLVSIIEGTQTVKCMVRIENTVNVIGVWELNDLNDVQVKVYEVKFENGHTDILMLGYSDRKALQMNLFRLVGEDLEDLGYNYIEQKIPGEQMRIEVNENTVQLFYDNGTEKPKYAIVNGVFEEVF